MVKERRTIKDDLKRRDSAEPAPQKPQFSVEYYETLEEINPTMRDLVRKSKLKRKKSNQ